MTAQIDTASGKNRSTENFPVGSFLIRADLRPHVHALYNFARAADDISDHPLLEAEDKIARLDQFAVTLLGKDDLVPSAVALRQSLKKSGVSPQHALDLLTAFKRDATQLRYRDWNDLIDYCNYSAAPVGRHVLALHSIGNETWKANDALCNALQIINHIQDCTDDYAQLNRVYIPQDMMAKNGADITDLSNEQSTPALRATLSDMLALLDPMLTKAREFPALVPERRLKAEVAVICALAENLVALLRKRDPLCDNVKLGKISILGATFAGIARVWL